MTKRKQMYQQLGSKSKLRLSLGNKRTNAYLDELESKADAFYIQKLREAYSNTTIVTNVEYSDEEKTMIRLLKGEVNGLKLQQTLVIDDNIIYIFDDKSTEYIVVINRYAGFYETKKKVMLDIQEIYKSVENHLKKENYVPALRISKSKETVVGSFGYSSALAEAIAVKYNIHHIAFNPVLFNSKARVYKIRGDPLSLYAVGQQTYEIVKTFSGLDNNASNIKNF